MTIQTISLHTSPSGDTTSIDIYRYTNDIGGKIIYIQAGLHGNEITGIAVIYELIEYIQIHKPTINCILVPIANPFSLNSQVMGMQTGYNNIHTNQQNCHNYNRLGSGVNSPFEDQIIQTLLNLSSQADIVLDLHCAGYESGYHIYCHTSLQETAKPLGLDCVLTRDQPSKAFEDVCFARGQEAYTLELGAARTPSIDSIQRGLQACMIALGLTEPLATDICVPDNHIYKLYAPSAGILVREATIGHTYTAGSQLGYIYTRDGKKKTVVTPHDSIFLIKNPIHAPYHNQEIAQVVTV